MDFEKRWKLYDKNSFDEDVELLGTIAMQWRAACSAHRNKQRIFCGEAINSYMEDYEKAVVRLINSGKWFEAPPPEDQLPSDMMPRQYYEYWNLERKPPVPEQTTTFYDILAVACTEWLFLMVVIIVVLAIVIFL